MNLTPEERVRLLLSMIPYMRERRHLGNYYDSDDLNDIEDAVARADLTERQRVGIELVFVRDYTHAEAAKLMGLGRSTLSEHVDKAVMRITEEYEREFNYESDGA